MNKYLWYSDTHLNGAFPWAKALMYHSISKECPKGLFLTGDISNGIFIKHDLEQLAKHINLVKQTVATNLFYQQIAVNTSK